MVLPCEAGSRPGTQKCNGILGPWPSLGRHQSPAVGGAPCSRFGITAFSEPLDGFRTSAVGDRFLDLPADSAHQPLATLA